MAAKNLSSLLTQYEPQLEEARHFLAHCLAVFSITFISCLVFNRQIIRFLTSIFDLKNVNIVLTSPYQFVNLAIGIALVISIIVTFPVLLSYLIKYIRPALTSAEFSLLKKIVPASVFLLIIGGIFGIKIEQFVITLYSQTTSEYSLSNFWDIEAFLNQVIIMVLTMGLIFQLPIILTLLIRLKVISTKFLAQQRRYVYLALTIFAVLLPPNDALSLIIIITPLFLLFEGTLLLNRTS